MKATTTWQIIVLIVILMTHSSQANKVCPTESTQNSNFPVVHMCTNEAVSGVQGLFFDAFVSANKPANCNCTLKTRQNLQIGINHVILPDKHCTSTLHIPSQGPVIYNCKSNTTIPMYGRNLHNAGLLIKLTTKAGHENITYCIKLKITGGHGSLSFRCFWPNGSSASSPVTIPAVNSVSSTQPRVVRPTSVSTRSTQPNRLNTTQPSAKMYQSTSNPETILVAAVAGGIGGVVLIAVVVIVVVVLVKRKRRKKNQESNDDGDYVNVNANAYTNQNTESFGRHPGVLTDQNQTGNQTIRSPSDDYVSIDDEAGGTTWKPHVALKPNLPSTSMHVNLQPEPDEDDVSNMYAKVNKKKKPIKSVKGPDLPVMHDNELYSVVDKTKKTKLSLKPKPSCDVYAVVNKQKKYRGKSPESIGKGSESEITGDVYTEVRKPKKSGGKSPESKGHGPESEVTGDVYTEVRKPKKSGGKSPKSKGQGLESEITGDVYTEVRKPKKSGNKPNIPKASAGLVYSEDQEQEQGATGGYGDKTNSVDGDVLYSTIC